jgi:hypothetical protein
MSAKPRESGLECLFSDPGRKLDNIKFYRRSDVPITQARFKEEVCASVERRRAPGAKISQSPPSCRKAPIDLRALVADM